MVIPSRNGTRWWVNAESVNILYQIATHKVRRTRTDTRHGIVCSIKIIIPSTLTRAPFRLSAIRTLSPPTDLVHDANTTLQTPTRTLRLSKSKDKPRRRTRVTLTRAVRGG